MLSCRQIRGSFACAKKTAEVMRLLITTQRHADAASLIEDVRTVGTKLQAAKPVGEPQGSSAAAVGRA
jgi:translation initiation factor eIF-2B subunit beta